ncbi:MAG TPA: HD domain-containing protein [Pyrinomonadaceae bacterium]|nr:HD domain-containing protein [Pyrinomonadaceae bacterium]
MLETNIPLVDTILGRFRHTIGNDFDGYRNHVYRMINFCFALGNISDEERDKIVIAGCFHDIGIWTGNTFDYLSPSVRSAEEYLSAVALEHLADDVKFMIDQHHKLRQIDRTHALAELFRKGDLVDFSLGLVKFDLDPTFVREVKREFPNAGFHKRLVKLAGRWTCRHPLNPIPVLKW